MSVPRHTDLDRARGLAIALVVFGHIVARQPPTDAHWYEILRRVIYSFHMPFFFYLSGRVAMLSGQFATPLADLPALIKSRAHRLLLPALILGPTIILAKRLAAPFITVDNVPVSIPAGLINLIWHPNHSPAYDLWFLIVLFALSIAAPLLRRCTGNRLWLILLLASAAYLIPLPSHLYAALIGRYALFYGVGLATGAAGAAWLAWIDRHALACLAAFALGGVLVATLNLPFAVTLLPMGLLSMPALNALVRFPRLNSALWLENLGRFSMAIYLLNTICIGLAKAGLLALASWNGWHFFAFAPLLLAAGLLGPILIKRQALPAIPALDRLTD
ncbi:MAG TPA: acyltransferase [Acidiphilium sp.]|nr:MAG: acyltransferase [Acidiphilium sp. 21-60-14]OYV92381.1 MAG: acyltransferase [Acidiphilium sp. 37-60-79]HQT89202.1 acyltransferase [Acidiphilium sp.]HQU24426.1 acyltransferase [Acidiphilium sp.]